MTGLVEDGHTNFCLILEYQEGSYAEEQYRQWKPL